MEPTCKKSLQVQLGGQSKMPRKKMPRKRLPLGLPLVQSLAAYLKPSDSDRLMETLKKPPEGGS